jgi:hypothetical protein
MSSIHRLRITISAFSVVLLLALTAPIAVRAAEQFLTKAPGVPSCDETSDCSSVETNPTTITGEGSPAESSVLASRSNDIGSVQEEFFAAAAAAPTSDGTSGNRPVEARRLMAAQHALMTHDLGTMQEDALLAVVEASSAAEASGGETPAPTGAELLAQLHAVELSLSRYVGTDQQVPSCAAHS